MSELVRVAGPAAGRITGFNHVVLVCREMERSVRFYRDLLGLEVARTAPERRGYERQYFFRLGNGEFFSLYQMSTSAERPQPPIVNGVYPGSDGTPPERPEKMDHLAFNVDTMETLLWFQSHLRAHGVEVSDVKGGPVGADFIPGRIYFYDPDRNPLEIATLALDDPRWADFDPDAWFEDDPPVPSMLTRSVA